MEEKPEITIRYAKEDDYPWFRNHDKHISENKIKNNEIYVVEINKKIIGWLRYNLFWDCIPFMNLIYFLEDYRRIGIGKKLVEYWEKDMKQKGYNNVLTSTQSNEDAQHFYRKIGYMEIGGFKFMDDPFEIIFQKII